MAIYMRLPNHEGRIMDGRTRRLAGTAVHAVAAARCLAGVRAVPLYWMAITSLKSNQDSTAARSCR